MITAKHVTEVEPHVFVCEASSLYEIYPGFQTGWPIQVWTTLGNGLPLRRVSKKVDAEGDTLYVRYQQQNGCITLKVFND